MNFARRVTLTLVVVALLSAAAYGVGWAIKPASDPIAFEAPRTGSTVSPDATPSPDDPSQPSSPAEPTEPSSPAEPADPSQPSAPTEPADPVSPEPEPEPQAGPRLMGPGDDNDEVRELQARLRQIEWFNQDVTGLYGDVTTEAVRGFQAKRGIAVTGEVDQTTLDRLLAMTTEPTPAELANELGENTPGALDPRCLEADALCIDKSTSTLRWVVDGTVQTTLDVRFGSEYTPTREGLFSVESKSPDHVSSIYGSEMPFAMFFSGGQAVHYSSDFAAVGYAGASHGCVNVRDYDAIAALFDQVDVGDRVVVYRS